MANYTHTRLSEFNALKAIAADTPFDQLVLMRFKSTAVYADGESIEPRVAYDRYFRQVYGVMHRLGVMPVWQGYPLLTLVGPEDERWDVCHVRRYPSIDLYRALLQDEEYIEALTHWRAAIEDCRVICAASEMV